MLKRCLGQRPTQGKTKMSATNTVNELTRMVESLSVARNFNDLRSAVNAGHAWDNRQLMIAVDDRNQSVNKAFVATEKSIRAVTTIATNNERRITGCEEGITGMEGQILGKVKGALDVMEDTVVTKEELKAELAKSTLTKDVRQLERAVTTDERGFCTMTLILHGLMQVVVGREKPNETLELVWSKFLVHVGLTPQDLQLLSATRMPKGRNSTKPAPIKLRFLTPADVHLVLENLHLLKGVTQCKGMHIERDVPLMLNEQRKKGNAIVYQYRKVHGMEYQAKVWYPGNRVQVAVRKKGESEYKDLTKKEMDDLYEANKKFNSNTSWADDDPTDGASGAAGGASSSASASNKRPRSTPGESSRSKTSKFSDQLFQ